MDVFISWSHETSGAVANVLAKYLQALINVVRPWLSSKDISTGARWGAEIAAKLESAHVGIICLTAENQHEPWILFEAGAIAKQALNARALVLRIDLKASEVTGPLSQFQSVSLDEDGIKRLITSINHVGGNPLNDEILTLSFNAHWPRMKQEFEQALKTTSTVSGKRSEEEMLEELVTVVRQTDIRQQQMESLLTEISQRIPSNPFYGSLDPNYWPVSQMYKAVNAARSPYSILHPDLFAANEPASGSRDAEEGSILKNSSKTKDKE
jgi:hypothetical protein